MIGRRSIERPEEGHALNVIPVEVRDEDVRERRYAARLGVGLQLMAKQPEAGAAIENIELVAEAHLYAGGVTSVAHISGLRSRRRSTDSPELDPHPPSFPLYVVAEITSSDAAREASIVSLVPKVMLGLQKAAFLSSDGCRGARLVLPTGTRGLVSKYFELRPAVRANGCPL